MPPTCSEMAINGVTRRQFLKAAGSGLAALCLLPMLGRYRQVAGHGLGRITGDDTEVFMQASNKGQAKTLLFKDQLFNILSVVRSEDGPDYNPVWYELEGQGFVHSGAVQPVEISTNVAVSTLPANGALFEVTVPYTDTLWSTRLKRFIAYRLYYSTTHWVTEIVRDKQGGSWYKIKDDKWGFVHYASPAHLRMLTAEDVAPISPDVPAHLKRLEIRLGSQTVIAYEDNTPVYMTRAATGAKFSNGDFRTPIGYFQTARKRPSRHMASGDPAAPNGYDLPGIPWVCYITESGMAFHGTYWHNDFGKPRSHGCINVSSEAARWIYRWTNPVVALEKEYAADYTGTSVDIME